MNKKLTTYHICMLALAVVVNFIGGQIALMFHLPIYLDSIGTFLWQPLVDHSMVWFLIH